MLMWLTGAYSSGPHRRVASRTHRSICSVQLSALPGNRRTPFKANLSNGSGAVGTAGRAPRICNSGGRGTATGPRSTGPVIGGTGGNGCRTCDAGVSVARGRGTATSPGLVAFAGGGAIDPGRIARAAAGRKVARDRAACAASSREGHSPSITAGAAARSLAQGAVGRAISRHKPCIIDVVYGV